MKYAFFSDIHANLPALEAVLKSIDTWRPDAVYCLGDLVGYAPWPNEVVKTIRERHIPTIAGNYDHGVGLRSDDCGCAYKTPADADRGKQSIRYTNEVVSDETRSYLASLPRHIRIDTRASGESHSMLMVHGSPRKINQYLFEDQPEKSLLRLMHGAAADIMLFGHTHKPYHRPVMDNSGKWPIHRHAINLGSVGKPKDGDARACWVALDIDERISRDDPESIRPEFVRVPYDVERAATAIESSPLPGEFADMLRRAY